MAVGPEICLRSWASIDEPNAPTNRSFGMRSIIRTLGIGVASTALVLTAPAAALAGGDHDHDDGHGHHGDDNGHGHHGDDNGHGHHGDDNGHGHDDNGDTTIDEIVDPGTFDEHEAETAVITIEYTCPEDADAALTVWLKQEQDNKRHHDDETVRGSETVYDLDCTDESEEVDVEVEADDDAEWEEGDAKARAFLVSKDDHDVETDFERAEIELEED
jgi:hypothetical protein